jgi:hypothetical protein
MALQPQVAGVVGYRDLTDFGTVTNFGVSASWLRPLGHSTQDAVSGGFSVLATGQSVHLNATGQPTRSFPRWGVALAIQDKIPYYEGEGRGISRWQWKGGVEYQGPGGDDIGETYGLFVRYRPLSGGNDHPQPVEYGLSLGRGPMQETLVGLSIAATVRL